MFWWPQGAPVFIPPGLCLMSAPRQIKPLVSQESGQEPPGGWSCSAQGPPFQHPLPSHPYPQPERDPSPVRTVEMDIPPPPHETLAGQAAVQRAGACPAEQPLPPPPLV